jgi:endonuclease/exonuclease/phosphatase family metal-dependent hydrolase
MKALLPVIIVILAILVVYAGLVFAANRWNRPAFGDLAVAPGAAEGRAGETLSAVTWNIGYGALGARADFLVDGGSNLRVLDREEIESGADAIADRLGAFDADVLLLQEVASPSFLTRMVDVRARIENRLSRLDRCFWADFSTRMVPPPLTIRHGMMLAARHPVGRCEVLRLPQDPKFYYGFLKKYYGGLVARFPVEGSDRTWTVIDIHLSAFDEDAAVRRNQIEALFALAVAEYEAGNAVVIGGDWNMRLAPTEFPHRTEEKFLFWVYDFPGTALPEGWRLAVDPDTPTVRTLHKSYVAGENYTAVIDGFAVSPDVIVDEVRTSDLGFAHTDHHPVFGRFRLRERP